MKQLLTFLILCLLVTMLPGCWSRVEINDIAIITATAIDKTDDGKILLSVQIAIPKQLGPQGGQGGGGESQTTVLYSEVGETMMDASRNLQMKLPRNVLFSHSRNLIIGEKAARDGVNPIIDFFARGREARLRGYILFCKGKAAEVLQTAPILERYSSEAIREEEKKGLGLSIMQKDFIDMLTTEGISPVAALVSLKPVFHNGEGQSKLTPAINGAAIFRRDKLIGWMDSKEARGILWLRNELKTAHLTVIVPKERGGGKISVQLYHSDTKTRPMIQGNEVTMKVDIYSEGELYENSSSLDPSDPNSLYYIQSLLEHDVKERIEFALHKAQKEYNSDIFGFGNAIYRAYPVQWKSKWKEEWKDTFPKVKVIIQPQVSVVRTGLYTKSPKMKD